MKDSGIKKVTKLDRASGKMISMWQIRVTAQVTPSTGKPIRKSRMTHAAITTKRSRRLAIQAELLRKAEDACHDANPEKARLVSLTEFAESWAIEKIKAGRWCADREARVLKTLEVRILPVIGEHTARSINRDVIQAWIFEACSWRKPSRLRETKGMPTKTPYSKGVILLWFGVLRMVVRDFAAAFDIRDPICRLEWPKELNDRPTLERLAPSDATIERVLSQINSEQMRRLIAVLSATGCRVSEILNLEWQRVDLDKAIAQLGKQHTKTRTAREVVLLSKAVTALREQLQYQKENGGIRRLCFVSRDTGRAYTRSGVLAALAKACEKLGIERIKPHDTRRGCATERVNSGASLSVVAAFLGHKSPVMTARYTILDSNQIRDHLEPKPKEAEGKVCK